MHDGALAERLQAFASLARATAALATARAADTALASAILYLGRQAAPEAEAEATARK